jgi:chromate transporter
MVLWELFLAFFRVGLFAIGGAYSFLPLLEREVVEKYHWLTKDEFLDVLGMVKIFPGAISVKYATYAGYKIKGVSGAVMANLGNLLAPAVLVILASVFYAKYKNLPAFKNAFNMIQLAIFSMIIAVAFQLIQISELTQFKNLLVVIASFILFVYLRVHPALIIIVAGLLGALKF